MGSGDNEDGPPKNKHFFAIDDITIGTCEEGGLELMLGSSFAFMKNPSSFSFMNGIKNPILVPIWVLTNLDWFW
jgi:hypothetical protein